jgi:hypothetical protein
VLYSRETAHVVANTLLYYMREKPGAYATLEVRTYDDEIGMPNLNIRLDPDPKKTLLDNGSEVIHCMDDKDRRVDVVLGSPTERMSRPAEFIVQ